MAAAIVEGQKSITESFNVSAKKSDKLALAWEKTHSNMGLGMAAAAVMTGAFKNEDDFDESAGKGLTIMQAFSVVFCCAFGAGVAFQGWYPKLAGFYGYPMMILLVGANAGTAGNALFETARVSGAASFAELCQALPSWTRKVTPWCNIVWNFCIMGNYLGFIFSFINDQIVNAVTDKFDETGIGALPLYLFVGFLVFAATMPAGFGGSIMKAITNTNFAATWVVIFTAIIKGIHTVATTGDEEKETSNLVPGGFLQVMVLLAGAMFQVVPVPRLNYELEPELREKAGLYIPYGLALVQGTIFAAIGTLGYASLGDSISGNGDVFSAYNKRYPDFMVTILQGGIAVMMYLSTPMFSLMGKSELWGQISEKDEEGKPVVPFENSPLAFRLILNVSVVLPLTILMCFGGRTNYQNIFVVANGTVANWMNLFLPVLVIIYVRVLPAKRAGEDYISSLFKAICILLMGIAALYSSVAKILAIIDQDIVDGWPLVPQPDEGNATALVTMFFAK